MTMKLTPEEIARIISGELEQPKGAPAAGKIIITGAAGLKEASGTDVSYFSDSRFTGDLHKTKAGAVIISSGIPGFEKIKESIGVPLIKVKNALLSFTLILEILEKERSVRQEGVHKTAIVSKTAKLGSGVSVGAHCVVEENAFIGGGSVIFPQVYVGQNVKIGKNSKIYPQVVIRENVSIGENTIIHSGSVLGSDGFGYIKNGTLHKKIPQIGRIEVGDNVEIGANVAIDRATTGATVIGSGTKIDNLVHIAHNVRIGKNCLILGQVAVAGSSVLGDNVTLAGQSGVTDHANVGANVTVAGKSGVIGDIPDGQVVSGFPARPHRENMKTQAILHRLPDIIKSLKEKNK
ncbi:MAG: UDP-3-O-(3-hydroxymyristoyl)glucosamine N-acyltransferase [Elusimicrobia bacterium]|nr:UDP-3-O-(3-hydroxymyristoyl)glucosamine N-acyltransferase [Elusimicrobiota bacterium]